MARGQGGLDGATSVRVEEVEDPLMREARTLDKLIDELARRKKMGTILRAE